MVQSALGKRLAIILLALIPAMAFAQPSPTPTDAMPRVHIETGYLAGVVRGPAVVFRGVPYAAPPVGSRRWRPPAPVSAWSGIRPAITPAPACLQPLNPDGTPNGGGYIGPISEDCLTLNVTIPSTFRPGRGRGWPVMVWIPGGGNTQGGAEAPSYDAANFARDGIILVTMNYRLGPLGFMAHPALTREARSHQPLGNYGFLDQIAALQWVQRNIAAFGGDPRNVTLFGESAGGANTLALMTTPAARGLFHRAIVQSGGGWSEGETLAQREVAGVALATRLGLPQDATLAQLRAIPGDQIVALAGRGVAGPTIDRRLFTQSPTRAFARGQAADLPLIIGSNSNEASLVGGATAEIAAAAPAAIRQAYPDVTTDAELGRQIFNDSSFGAPARWIARRQARGAPAWLYYFSYVPERQRQTRPGTNHASEVPFVFDSLDAVPGRTPLIRPSEREMARLAHSCWTAFARTGRPNCAGQAWPAYDPATDQLLEFGIETGLRQHFRSRQLDAHEAENAGLLN